MEDRHSHYEDKSPYADFIITDTVSSESLKPKKKKRKKKETVGKKSETLDDVME